MNRQTLAALGMAGALVAGVLWAFRPSVGTHSGNDPYQKLVGHKVCDFRLTDSREKPLSLADLHGKIWVVELMFATCQDICLQLSKHMAELDALLPPEAPVRLVSVSVNPQVDTPEVLREYALRWKASDRWSFLTGDLAEIRRFAMEGLRLSPGTDQVLTHSDKFVLIDGEGVVRGYFNGLDKETPGRIAAEIRKLAAAPASGVPK